MPSESGAPRASGAAAGSAGPAAADDAGLGGGRAGNPPSAREAARERSPDGVQDTLKRIEETQAWAAQLTRGTSSFDETWADFKAKFDRLFELGAKKLAGHQQEEPSRPAEAVGPLRVAQALRRAARTVVLTGAGVSAESGIPTFRGQDGYWVVGSKNYRPQELATWEKFNEMPEEIWRWFQYRWGVCRAAKPNAGHRALAELEDLISMTLVTQNIDGLHVQAGSNPDRICEIHGRIDEIRCDDKVEGSCLYGLDLNDPANGEKARATVVKSPAPAAKQEDERLPACPRCGKRQRPKVLWFDECYTQALYRSKTALQAAEECDVLLVVGTQLTTGLPQRMVAAAQGAGALLVCVDPLVELADPAFAGMLHLRDKSGSALPKVLAELRALRSEPLPAPLADARGPRCPAAAVDPPPSRSATPARTASAKVSPPQTVAPAASRGGRPRASAAPATWGGGAQRAAAPAAGRPRLRPASAPSASRVSLRAAAAAALAPAASPAPQMAPAGHPAGFFVYGTLRPDDDSGAGWTAGFCSGMEAEVALLAGASLYLDGGYPSVCLERTRCEVRGVLLRPQGGGDFQASMSEKLAEADRIEGYPDLYHRDVVFVSVAESGGSHRMELAYLYHRTGRTDRERCACIADGDWLSRRRPGT